MKQCAEEDFNNNIHVKCIVAQKNVNAIYTNTPIFKRLLYVFTNIKASVKTFYFLTVQSSVFVLKAFI